MAFGLGQSRTGRWPIRENEDGDDGDKAGDGTLNDEQPTPSTDAAGALKVLNDATGNKSTKSTAHLCRREEN